GLGPMLLVIDEGAFTKLAARDLVAGQDVYSAWFSPDDSATSHWRQYLVSRSRLAERLMGSSSPGPSIERQPDFGLRPMDRHNQWLGFLGESEVVRRLAENSRLDLFRPFPDLEMVEVLARNRITHRYCGLQVKTGVPAEARRGEARIAIRKATLVPAPTTYIAALAWMAEQGQF